MEGLDSTNKLKNFEGAIPAELGIARLTYKAPLNELAVILANPDVQMGALPLIFCGFTRLLCAARVCF
jgi:hypothetical protein